MNSSLLQALPGTLLGLGIVAVTAGVLPGRPALRSALERLNARDAAPSARAALRWDLRAGEWLDERLPLAGSLRPDRRDLLLLDRTATELYRDKLLSAAAGLLLPWLLGGVAAALGMLPAPLAVLFGLPTAIAGWLLPDHRLRRRAAQAREDFARAVAVYLELVASERQRGAPAGQAMQTASSVSDGRVFLRIRQELTRARLAGAPPWSALAGLAEEIGVRELADVAKIVRLSGEQGASIAQTLRSRGRGLRVQLLAEEHARANQASERLAVPLTLLAFVFVGIILTPLVLGLTA